MAIRNSWSKPHSALSVAFADCIELLHLWLQIMQIWFAYWPKTFMLVLVTQSSPTLCDPMNYIPPGSSIHGILQARVRDWVCLRFCTGSSWSRDCTWVSRIAGRFFTIWATREALVFHKGPTVTAPRQTQRDLNSPLP